MNTYEPWQVCGQQKTTCKSLFFIPCEFQASNTGLEKTLFTGQASHLPHCSQSVHQGRVKKHTRKNTGQVWTLTSPQDDSALTLVNFKMRHVWFSSNVTVRAFFLSKHEFCLHCSEIAHKISFICHSSFFSTFVRSPPSPLRAPLPERQKSLSLPLSTHVLLDKLFPYPRSDAEPLWGQRERKCVESLGP